VVFDRGTKAGGLFREGIDVARLPRDVLDGEIACLERMGVEWRMGVELGRDASLDDLRREHDAVVLAMGAQVAAGAERRFAEKGYVGVKVEADLSLVAGMGLETRPRGVKADRQTTATNLEKVFAAGNVASGPNYAVHAVASGRRAALAVGQLLRGRAVVGEHEPVRVLMGGLGEAEQGEWRSFAHEGRRASIDGEEGPGARAALSAEAAAAEARRCLDCDCGNRRDCRLRLFADEYDATAKRFAGERRGFHRDDSHAEVVYESGKCIQCGICVRLAEEAGEELGLSPIGRGFTVTTGTPFEERLAAGLKRIGRRCAEACPTGALSLKRSLRLRAE